MRGLNVAELKRRTQNPFDRSSGTPIETWTMGSDATIVKNDCHEVDT